MNKTTIKNIMQFVIASLIKFFESGNQWLMRKLHLKNRYYYTRNNVVRLRYLALTALFVLTAMSGIIMVSGNSNAVVTVHTSLQDIEPTSGVSSRTAGMVDKLDREREGKFSLASLMVETPPEPAALPLDREITIEAGDALSTVMENQGVGITETRNIISVMKPHLDPRYIKAGQKIDLHFDDGEEVQQLREMKIKIDKLKTLVVARAGDDFTAHIDEKEVNKQIRAKEAQIEVSLSGSGAKAGIPSSIISEVIRIYSWNVDFQRDIRAKDKLEVLYESYETEGGHIAKTGNVLYAKLTLSGREIPLYRFKMNDGRIDYFGPDGISIKRTLMKTPINGARVSSGYGMRRHPVLGYNKMHRGLDFAAPTGTPIFAAGDGVVEKAGWFSSYGKYVRIRHNSQLKTAYAHMSKIHSNVKPGSRVTQGQVIGTVGSTGRSTGPHLHYEVIKNGKQVNPRSVDLPTGEELTGKDKEKFKTVVAQTKRQYASALEGTEVASFFRSLL